MDGSHLYHLISLREDGLQMKLSDVQRMMDSYFKGNRIVVVLRQFANVLALIYPIYLILTRISFLNVFTGVLGNISIILYFAYFIGLILCFAKNDILTVTIAFGLKAILEIIDLFVFSINLNAILSIIAYAAITVLALYYNNMNADA